MVLDYNQIGPLINGVIKTFNLDPEKENINKLLQKVENNNYYTTVECKELHVLTPTVKNGFFFKNTEIIFTNEYLIFGNFNKEMIMQVKKVKDKFVFKDIDGHKLECQKDDVSIRIKQIPLELFMNLLA